MRPEPRYLELVYDANSDRLPKSLRPQSGQKYDVRKVRNSYITNLFRLPAFIGCLSLLSTAPATLRAATITVTSIADTGPGTLRAALASAGYGDTIDATGVSGSILLTSGELLVTNSVTILGPGPSSLAVNGNAANRVFHIGSGNVVTIAGLTITNGKVSGGYPANSGGGIYNDGAFGSATLTVSNCCLRGNLAGYGAGIYNDGYKGNATLTCG